ncbi:MAG: radical SAM protein [Dehalococcoidia bacterium]|nr:radical SAM protein [Dehalococcoidia bacterium]
MKSRLSDCEICPRRCGVNRLKDERGDCNSGALPVISAACDHHGEEPAISGTRGSGTIFFSNCNLKCVYCQNYQISQNKNCQHVNEVDSRSLALKMLYLQDELGCHNINLVSPTHFVPHILEALLDAIPMGLRLPLVYNTNAYDSIETLRELDGIVDIYLPDIKYSSDKYAMKYSRARNYVDSSRQAIREMHRQVGNLVMDGDGIAKRGLIVRHLILPNDIAGSSDSLSWLVNNVSTEVTLSIMAQYSPYHLAPRVPLLSRKISGFEYQTVLNLLERLGIENGWVQELDSSEIYIPDFKRDGHPFSMQVK